MNTHIRFEDGNLIVTRVYAAAIEDVFDAWIETSKVKQWWGCAECTNVDSEIEPKVGGKYNHHMTLETEHGTLAVPGFATLTEYDPPHRIAYTSNDDNDPMVITVTFTIVSGGTQVVMVQSNIPDMTVQGDVKLMEVVRDGWTAAFEKMTSVFTDKEVA